MLLVPIVFFLMGRLCCGANYIFEAGVMLRGHEADLFQEYWLIISCHFWFLQDLSLMRCSLSIFFGLGSRIMTFINYCIVYMKNLYWKELTPLFQNARVYAEKIILFMLSFCAVISCYIIL